MNIAWLEEEIEILKEKWADGLSQSSIARLLGKTRNAVAGKIDRMGLSRPLDAATTARQRASRYMVIEKRLRAPRTPRTPAGTFARQVWMAPRSLPREFKNIDLNLHCRYVTGEIRGFETPMCGEPIHAGAYCGFHDKITHLRRYNNGALRDEAPKDPVAGRLHPDQATGSLIREEENAPPGASGRASASSPPAQAAVLPVFPAGDETA